MKIEKITIDNKEFIFKIHMESRNNFSVSIRNNIANIRAPFNAKREELFSEILKMKQWAIDKFKNNMDKFKQEIDKEYKDGEILKICNEEFLLKINFLKKISSSARISDNIIILNIAEGKNHHIPIILSRAVGRKILPKLEEKIKILNEKHFQMPLKRIFFKNTKSLWGSCSKKGNINISTRLLFVPEEVLEYVCIHELSHLKEFNHSDNFWKLVEKAMPDYLEKEKWLKENGGICKF